MIQPRIASLPMYDFAPLREAHDALWASLAGRLRDAGMAGVPDALTWSIDHVASWLHPGLLLGQACEYPLVKRFAGRVRLVATPHYAAPGCEAGRYRSAIVVRESDGAATLHDLRGRRCIVNEPDSNSGMNLLRAAIAPIARGESFFSSIALSGSHLASARQVADACADVAAIDCVTFAHFGRFHADLTARLRVLAWTAASPSLPWITAASSGDGTLAILRHALAQISHDATLAAVRRRLLLTGFSLDPDESFSEVLQIERGAAAAGCSALA